MGWSFGTELVLKHGADPSIEGAILPPHRCIARATPTWSAWAACKPVTILVPEHDDYLQPEEARSGSPDSSGADHRG